MTVYDFELWLEFFRVRAKEEKEAMGKAGGGSKMAPKRPRKGK